MTDAGSVATRTSRRTRAVSRSLDSARAAAEARVQRFLDAGFALIETAGADGLTVQNVVEQSGLSLRSFYKHFGGKYELLLALFEESVRMTAEHIHAEMDATDDPLGRFRLLVVEYHRVCRLGQPRASDKRLPPRAIAPFAYELLANHQEEAAEAFAPLVSLVQTTLDDAASAGIIRTDLDHREVAGHLLQTIMFHTFADRITGSPAPDDPTDSGERLWERVLHGLAGPR